MAMKKSVDDLSCFFSQDCYLWIKPRMSEHTRKHCLGKTRAVPGKGRKIREAVCTARHKATLRRVINSSGCSRLWKCRPAFLYGYITLPPATGLVSVPVLPWFTAFALSMHWWDLIFLSVAGDSPRLWILRVGKVEEVTGRWNSSIEMLTAVKC